MRIRGEQKPYLPSSLTEKQRREYNRMIKLYKEKRLGYTLDDIVARTLIHSGVSLKNGFIGWIIVY